MGIMICAIHGRVGFMETCSHVGGQIDAKNKPTGHHLTILRGHILVCSDCYLALGFENFASLSGLSLDETVDADDGRMEAYETAYNAIENRRVFCLECLKEL